MKIKSVFILSVILLCGCDLITCPLMGKPKAKEHTIVLLMTAPDEPFEEVGFIEIETTKDASLDKINKAFAERAFKFGADAVINIEYTEAQSPLGSMAASSLTMVNKRYAKGTAVKFLQ